MDPQRWAQIVGSFGAERGESSETSKKAPCSPRPQHSYVTPRNKVKYVLAMESSENADERALKEKSTSSLISNERLNKGRQLESDRYSSCCPFDACDMLCYMFDSFYGKSESDCDTTMKLLWDKIDCLEKRMNGVAEFLQTQFSQPNQNCMVDRVGKSSFPLKSWMKPPSIHPKPTSSSTKREVFTRSRYAYSSNNSVSPGNNETGIGSMHHQSGSSNGNDHDLELRVQFLESLVVQLKSRFMKLIHIHRIQK
ncbi:unnamed protein product [Orchesella dallaii]|uniref:Uncharacterized protein n=1 Tax=Orchesella dallaii TaxID=48710 RepID=A0ABP1QEP3_9HEXA